MSERTGKIKTTGTLAIVMATTEAACRIHDERIGRGRAAHLFHMPEEVEISLRTQHASVVTELQGAGQEVSGNRKSSIPDKDAPGF